MAAVATTVTGKVEVIRDDRSKTLVAAADINAWQAIRKNTSGKWVLANATDAANSVGVHIALRTVKAGQALTGMRRGKLGGLAALGTYQAPLYLSDTSGTIQTTAGTVSVVLARVAASTGNVITDAHDKNVEVDCPF